MAKKEEKCKCDETCTCGCQEGKECTCECGCQEGKECTCEENCKCQNDKKNSKKDSSELKKLKEQNKELNDKVLRLSAEIQNIGKRHELEISNLLKYEGVDLIKNLLPIVDNFERSIEMDKSVDEKYLQGYKMIYTSLINLLKSIGVEEIICEDKEFDPNLMDAIMTEHVDGVDPGYVLIVLQKGYTYKDKIIRHAFVKVSE